MVRRLGEIDSYVFQLIHRLKGKAMVGFVIEKLLMGKEEVQLNVKTQGLSLLSR